MHSKHSDVVVGLCSLERNAERQASDITSHTQSALDSEKTGALHPEITVNTQLAFDSINGMFRGPLREEFGWQGYEPTATVRLAEPTVTMSTKAALEAVSGMFKASLPGKSEIQRKPSEDRHDNKRPSSAKSRDSVLAGKGRNLSWRIVLVMG